MNTRGAISIWLASILLLLSCLSMTGCDDGGPKCYESICGPPVVTAGEDQEAIVGTVITLSGDVRLPPESQEICAAEKETLVFEWEQTSGTSVTLTDANRSTASFTPTEIGEYRFRFRSTFPASHTNCTEDASQWDEVAITVVDVPCDPPIADAGADQQVATPPGTPVTVTLDGSGSQTVNQQGCELSLVSYNWTVVSNPAGAQVIINNSDQVQTSASLEVLGIYEFQLEVQDDGGTGNRTDTATDVVQVEVLRDCGVSMVVTVIDAETMNPVAGANVVVSHPSGGSATQVADASGEATLDIQSTLPPRSISISSSETVPSITGQGADRPKYESTTVLEYAGCEITVPLRLTGSGEAAKPTGTVVAKVPANVFNMLPHSWRCLGDCDSDADCVETYYCELDESMPCGPQPPAVPYGSCTPRSLLPSFSLGDPYISGQFRFVMLVPVMQDSDFTYRDLSKIFAPPMTQDDVWPGNLATDDTFFNGLGEALGRDPWGRLCASTLDCPNTVDYVCMLAPLGDNRCKDKKPMRDIRVKTVAGQGVKFALVAGIIDISMPDLLTVLLPLISGGGQAPDMSAVLLSSFQMSTADVCIFSVDVSAGSETDITGVLAGLEQSNCWNVDYQQMAVIGPIVQPGAPLQACTTNANCCVGGSCGWPDSGMMCLPSPTNPGHSYCYYPLFKEMLVTNEHVDVERSQTGFDPGQVAADGRLCSHMPADAPFEVMCPAATPGFYQECDPRDIRQLQVPPDAECSYPYGVTLVSIDVPAGHTDLPDGGRVFIGYKFNHLPTHGYQPPNLLVPSIVLNGTPSLSATQMYFRNLQRSDLGGIFEGMPGYLTAQTSSDSMTATLQLPDYTSVPALDVPPADAGFTVRVVFETDDPTVFPPVLTRTYAMAVEALKPQAGRHDIVYDLSETTLTGESLKGVVLAKVDYEVNATYVDNWWRVYTPAGTKDITLPAGESPFLSGDYVWITPFGAGFGQPFNYSSFPTDILLGPMSQYSEDSYAVVVP